MERNERKDKIIENFYNDPLTTGNTRVLFDKIKKSGIYDIDRKYIKKWLDL
jgi:Ribonuclease G/E